MKNLRIREEIKFIEAPYYGIVETRVYNFCKDFETDLNYSERLREYGEVIETFNSKENAEIFMNALKQLKNVI